MAEDGKSRRELFEEEVMEFIDGLYGYALHLTRNPEDACDLVQETYARAFKAQEQYTLGTNARAWLFAILRNTFLNQIRSASRRPKEVQCDWVDELPHHGVEEIRKFGPDPYDQFLNDLLREDIEKALDELPEPFKSAVVLCDVEGFSYKEISEILGVPIGTVRSRIHRGRSHLRKRLERWYEKREGEKKA
ncbi:MAG: sigma-70 family RNA polymerase sigma factor [Candidatus Fermentibacteraceae bacterium]